ncbi:hypothetical protein NVP1215B_092 [Vibrio phage 1.215.B._10N.222.54.F7]|nr:hypothetical protein NVP1215A_092 [Vibrio phage 1.215.A._10N.222.54.F7]AUR96115.1 hypothetical protein NVP1215B_092 [Vibrio phage 1.215.B._10N.222.54.F7]
MAVKIAKNIASKKAAKPNKAPKKAAPTPGTIVDGAIVETGVVKAGTKKPTTKIDTSAIAQPSVLKEGLKPFVTKLSDKKKIAAASKKNADTDAKAVKALEVDIVAFANDNNLADTATIDVTVDGQILTVGKAAEGKTLTDALAAYAMLEGIEAGLGDKLLTFKMGDLEKHLTSKQLEQVVSTSTDTKKRRVTLKDE